MSDLIEDGDGVPYPVCRHCGRQVKPLDGSAILRWIHIHNNKMGCHWYTYSYAQADLEYEWEERYWLSGWDSV